MKSKIVLIAISIVTVFLLLSFQLNNSNKQVTDGSIATILSDHIGEKVEVGHPSSGFSTVTLSAVYKDCYKITDDDGKKYNVLPFSDIIKISFHRNGNFLIATSHGNMGEINY